jgi:hypothetical protein
MYRVKKRVLKFLALPILLLTQSTLCIWPPHHLIVPRIYIEHKKVYIKRHMSLFLVQRAIVASGREVGALG